MFFIITYLTEKDWVKLNVMDSAGLLLIKMS